MLPAGYTLKNWNKLPDARLIESIYKKIGELKIIYPHNKDNPKYRWNVRVQNIIE